MDGFSSTLDALTFVAEQVVAEARREGVSLSEVEQAMLYFSEVEETPPGIIEANAAFERDYDQDEYEAKIVRLLKGAGRHARRESKQTRDRWSNALRTLRQGDHFLLVMIDAADV